jgi:hypothetical protein
MVTAINIKMNLQVLGENQDGAIKAIVIIEPNTTRSVTAAATVVMGNQWLGKGVDYMSSKPLVIRYKYNKFDGKEESRQEAEEKVSQQAVLSGGNSSKKGNAEEEGEWEEISDGRAARKGSEDSHRPVARGRGYDEDLKHWF